MKVSKENEYAALIIGVIVEHFLDKESEFYVMDELMEDDENITAFIHALASLAPATIHKQITVSGGDIIDFNHLANRLIFQYLNK